MIVQDDAVQAARSRIAGTRLRGGARPEPERLPNFSPGWPARLPAFVDPGREVVKRGPHALDCLLERPYPDGCATAERDRFREGQVERMKDKAP